MPSTDLFLEARASLAKHLGLPVPIRMLLAALQSPALMNLGTPPLPLLQRAGIPRIMLAQLGGLLPDVVRTGLRSMPPAPLRSFRSRVEKLPTNGDGRRGTVGYFAGCCMNWGYADAAMATRTMLTRGGFRVEVPAVVCCGVPHRAYGDSEAARDLARKNIAALERYEYVVTDCASCGAALKEYKHLLKDDPEAARQDPKSARAWSLLGDTSYKMKEYGDAEKAYRKAADLDPSSGGLRNNLAWVYVEQGQDLDTARELVVKALALTPEHRPYYLDTLGVVLMKLGRHQEAVAALKESTETIPIGQAAFLAEAYGHLADAYRATGNEAAAREASAKREQALEKK